MNPNGRQRKDKQLAIIRSKFSIYGCTKTAYNKFHCRKSEARGLNPSSNAPCWWFFMAGNMDPRYPGPVCVLRRTSPSNPISQLCKSCIAATPLFNCHCDVPVLRIILRALLFRFASRTINKFHVADSSGLHKFVVSWASLSKSISHSRRSCI